MGSVVRPYFRYRMCGSCLPVVEPEHKQASRVVLSPIITGCNWTADGMYAKNVWTALQTPINDRLRRRWCVVRQIVMVSHVYAWKVIIFCRGSFFFFKRRARRSPNRMQPNVATYSEVSKIWKSSSNIWGFSPLKRRTPKCPFRWFYEDIISGNVFGLNCAIDK